MYMKHAVWAGLFLAVGCGDTPSQPVAPVAPPKPAPVPSALDVTPSRWAFLDIGESVTFTTEIRDTRELPIADFPVVWSSSNPSAVTVDRTGTAVAVGQGKATLTATAGPITVDIRTVSAMYPIHFDYREEVPPEQRARFRDAANYFMLALADNDPGPTFVERTEICRGPEWEIPPVFISGLLIIVDIKEEARWVAAAGWCHKNDAGLPVVGRIRISPILMEREPDADYERVIRHEMGHILGIGTGWPLSGMNDGDPHFAGTEAVIAFDAAGGTDYTGGKVPVKGRIHWPSSIFGCEVMASGCAHLGIISPTSAITLGAIADRGFVVDMSMADPYTIPPENIAGSIVPSLPDTYLTLREDK